MTSSCSRRGGFDSDSDEMEGLVEGLPRLEDPFIQQYMSGRRNLITEEKKQRTDHAFRQTLSPAAMEACSIVSNIRLQEHQTIWSREKEGELVQGECASLYPGMMFTLAKSTIAESSLWKIVQRMPKGALLHAHLDAMVDIDWLLDQALATDHMHFSSSEPLTSAHALETASVLFSYSPASLPSGASVWDTQFEPNSRIPVAAAADSFPNGGRTAFLSWIKSRCSITPGESLKHQDGPNAIWRKFQSTFPIIGSILLYEPIFRAAIRRICSQLLADRVQWVDFRMAFVTPFRREGSETPDTGFVEMIRAMGEEITTFKQTEGQGFWGARMIWTALRRLDTGAILKSMNECIAVKKAYPDLIAGFDLVGQEELGRPLRDLTPELFWFRKRCVEEGVEIPFFFHAGECLGDGDETDENLFDAILLGTRRIGHGFSLYKHPLLIEMVKTKKILIESCPISNEILRLTGSVMSHPLPALLARGVHVSLCNDDPAILGQESNGLSHDFWQALQGWENLGLAGLGALAENSVRWAAFEDQSSKDWSTDIKDATFGRGIRAARMKEWALEWERFCQWIVDEYGAEEQQ